MMKFCYVFLIALLVTSTVYSQNKTMGVGTPTPNPNAALHVESPTNNQGFIMPRLTTAQRTAMAALPLTASDEGLMVYDKDLNVTFVWDGTSWQSPSKSAAKFYITDPASIDTALTATTYSNQPHGFAISGVHKGTGDAAGFFLIDNNVSTNPTLYAEHRGQGPGVMGNITTAAGTGFAVLGNTSGDQGSGVAGFASGANSNAGIFIASNPVNTRPALYGSTQGTGSAILGETSNGNSALAGIHNGAAGNAGLFSITNAANTSPVLLINNAGTGNAIQTAGKIQAGQFIGDGSLLSNVTASPFTFPFNTPQSTATTTWDVVNSGTGSAGSFSITNPANTAPVLLANTDGSGALLRAISTGTGRGAWFSLNGASAFPALRADTQGTGYAAYFQVSNNASGAPVIATQNMGTGPVLDAWISNTTSAGKALWVTHDGLGMGLEVNLSNASNAQPGIKINHLGTGNAIETTGKIQAGEFIGKINGKFALPYSDTVTTVAPNSSLFEIVYNSTDAQNVGVAHFENLNPNSVFSTLFVRNNGTNSAGYFQQLNPLSNSAALRGITNSNTAGGHATLGITSGTGGSAGTFTINNAGNANAALTATTNGTGASAFFTKNVGTAYPTLVSENLNNGQAALFTKSGSGGGAPIEVIQNGTGDHGAVFLGQNTANTGNLIFAHNYMQGTAAFISQNNASGNILDLASNYAIKASVDQTGKVIANSFQGDGSLLTNVASSSLALPLVQTNTNAGDGVTLLDISTNAAVSTDITNVAHFQNLNASAFSNVFKVTNAGSGAAFVLTSSGTGSGALFTTTNAANSFPALRGQTNGTGVAVQATINNPTSTATAFNATTNGNGNAGTFTVNNASNTNAGILVGTNGTGDGIYAELDNATATNAALKGRAVNTGGSAGAFEIFNASNGFDALYSYTQGTGKAGSFSIDNTGNSTDALIASTNGSGNALSGYTNGTGRAGWFHIQNPASTAPGITIFNEGNGTGLNIDLANTSGFKRGVDVNHQGEQGEAAVFRNTNTANNNAALFVESSGTAGGAQAISAATTGPAYSAILGQSNGTSGHAGKFVVNDPGNGSPALWAESLGNGKAGSFTIANSTSSDAALFSTTNGVGNSLFVTTTNPSNTANALAISQAGTGNGLDSWLPNSSNTGNAVQAATNGTGNALLANHVGASGNIAVFQSGGSNRARIDKAGIGYFNGGTQNTGADVAELFDVEGSKSEYEPGDVLVISESTDRTVEKSTSPNSRKVVGVYATKPGVLLTEKGMDEDPGNTVPMGVIGVIPTKVCLENGAIKRGDLLVTSSQTGKAMKAVPAVVNGIEIYPQGAIIGKALENFDGSGKALINVLVNVK